MAHAGNRVLLLLLAVMLAGCAGNARVSDQPGIRVGEEALRAGSAQIALQVARSILSRSPDDVPALLLRGDAQTQLGQNIDAESAFVKALEIDPKSVHARLGLGRIRLATDPAQAATFFEEVVRREPRNTNALNNLGIARDLLGQHQQAQEVYRQVRTIDPDMSAARVNLALSMAMSGDAVNAIPLIAPLAAEPAATAQVRHDYAAVLAMAGRDADAERILSHDLSPADVQVVMRTFHETRTGAAAPAEQPRQAPVSLRPPSAGDAAPPVRTNAVTAPNSPVSSKANGPHIANLGVYRSARAARAAWRHVRDKLPAAMAGRQPTTGKINQHGHARWRLALGGFASPSAVTAFCRGLRAASAACTQDDTPVHRHQPAATLIAGVRPASL